MASLKAGTRIRVEKSNSVRRLLFETMEVRRVMATVSIYETVDRTLINDNGFGSDFYDIALDTRPNSEVAFNLTSDTPSVSLFSQQSFTRQVIFTPDDWSPKRISVFGVGDSSANGNFQALLSQTISTQDPQYIGVSAPDVLVTVIDTETQPHLLTYDVELTEGSSQFYLVEPRYPSGYEGPAFSASYDTNQIRIEALNGGNTFFLRAINDGIVEGVHDVPITYQTEDANPDELSIPSPIVRIRDSEAPALSSFQVNGGAAQRSIVTLISLDFSVPVFVEPSAVVLTNTTTNTIVPLQILVDPSGLQVNIVFDSGSSVVDRFGGNTLADGNYVLYLPQYSVTNRESGESMQTDVVIGDTLDEGLFRLFGDLSGNGEIDPQEIAAFARSRLSSVGSANYVEAFDERGDGIVGMDDWRRFLKNIGRRR